MVFSSLTELMELKAAAMKRKSCDCSDQDIEVLDELIYAIALTEKSYLSPEQWENISLDNDKLSEDITFLRKEIEELEELSECAQSNLIMYGDSAKTIYSISWNKVDYQSDFELEGYNSNTLLWLSSADGRAALKNIGIIIADAADKGQSKIFFEYENCSDNSLAIMIVNRTDFEEYFQNLPDFFCIVKVLNYKICKVNGNSESGLFELNW